MTHVLFVCLGNICRSPTAEAVFRSKTDLHSCDSAGTGGWHTGDPPYPAMQAAAVARGYVMSDLRGRQLDVRDFGQFDLILGMDAQNIADIEAMRPRGAQTPVRLLTSFAPGLTEAVPDPYYTRDFDGAFDLIEQAVDGLIGHLGSAS